MVHPLAVDPRLLWGEARWNGIEGGADRGTPPVPGGRALCLRHGASLRPSPPSPITIACSRRCADGRSDGNRVPALGEPGSSCQRLFGRREEWLAALCVRIARRPTQGCTGRAFDSSSGARKRDGKPVSRHRLVVTASDTSAAGSVGTRAHSPPKIKRPGLQASVFEVWRASRSWSPTGRSLRREPAADVRTPSRRRPGRGSFPSDPGHPPAGSMGHV